MISKDNFDRNNIVREIVINNSSKHACEKHLTLSQTSPGFYMSAVQVF